MEPEPDSADPVARIIRELSEADLDSEFPKNVATGSKQKGRLPSPDALIPWGSSGPPQPGIWTTDVLGSPYECLTVDLEPDEEGPVVSTLVRRQLDSGLRGWMARRRLKFAVLFVHGRNDYFYHREFADKIAELGGAFYALDLRKYGRSLRPWQTIGFIDDLRKYDQELDWAVRVIREDHPDLPLVAVAHSTGGLTVPLWATRNPGLLAGMILNSAWLELQTYTAMRPAIHGLTSQLARVRPRAAIVGQSKNNAYFRTLSQGWEGSGFELPASLRGHLGDPAVTGWPLFEQWKLPYSYPAPAAWMQTILDGHAKIERGLHLGFPILSMSSSATGSEEEWTPEVFSSDIVLNAELIAERSALLGNQVTIERFPGKHDLLLSDPDVRQGIYDLIARWLSFSQIV